MKCYQFRLYDGKLIAINTALPYLDVYSNIHIQIPAYICGHVADGCGRV